MTLHQDLALSQIHIPFNWTYADAAARTAATGFVPGDIFKIALQEDDYSLWVLTDDSPETWEQLTGAGVGGAVTSVNGDTGTVVLDADDIDDSATTNKFSTSSELTKLAGIETGADVTDAGNVAAAGAVMEADTSTASMSFVVDEDNMASNSATKLASQQSIKAYVDSSIAAGAPAASDTVAGIVELATTAETTTGTDATRAVTPDGLHDMTSLAGAAWFLDEDNMATDSATKTSSQQAIKAYVDAQVVSGVPAASDTVAGKVELATTAETTTGTDADRAVTPDGLHDMTSLAGAAWFLDEDNMATDSATKTVSQQSLKAYVDATKTITINFVIDGGGAEITDGIKGDIILDFAHTIVQVTALADQTGDIVVDIWNDVYASFPPDNGDSITASAPVTITGGVKSQDATLTGWDTSGAAGSVYRFNVDSCTDIERCTISLKVVRA